MNLLFGDICLCKVVILIVDGVVESDVSDLCDVFCQEGVDVKLIVFSVLLVQVENGVELSFEGIWDGLLLVVFDVVFVFGGVVSSQVIGVDGCGLYYLLEVCKYLKLVVFVGDVQVLVSQFLLFGDFGVVFGVMVIDVFFGLCQVLMQYWIWQCEVVIKVIFV